MPGRVAGKVAFVTGPAEARALATRPGSRKRALTSALSSPSTPGTRSGERGPNGYAPNQHGPMSPSRDGREPLTSVRDRIQADVVGRERELGLVLAAVAAGRDILLEGPPGTSKSTLLRAITAEWGIPLVFVEGNADLTPAKLVGHHNPARVLREDYSPENFVDGPLVEAMRGGGFLYIEEFNRAPEDTLNTLLTAMAERRIAVPRVGEVVAGDTFRVIASMNPYDNIGTTRLSTSVHDRLCRLAITYQDAAAERGIVTLRAPRSDRALADLSPAVYERLVADAVAVTRATGSTRTLGRAAASAAPST